MRKLFAIAVLAVSITALGAEKKEFKELRFKNGEVVKVDANPKSFLLTEGDEGKFHKGIAEVVDTDEEEYRQLADRLRIQKRNQFELIREEIEAISELISDEKKARIITWIDAWLHMMNMLDVMIIDIEKFGMRKVVFQEEAIRLVERDAELKKSMFLFVRAIDELREVLPKPDDEKENG